MAMMAITSSGRKSADTQIMVGCGRLHGIILFTDGTNAGSAKVYDSEDSTLTGDIELAAVAAAGATLSKELILSEQGIEVNKGIYMDITGTGAEVIILYSPN